MQLRIPTHLSAGATNWAKAVRDDAGREWTESEWRLVQLAAEAWDRSQNARRILGREGLVCSLGIYEGPVDDRVHVGDRLTPHPAVAITRDAAAAFSRLTNQLGLDRQVQPVEADPGDAPGQTSILDELAQRREVS